MKLTSSSNINCRDSQGRNSTPLHLAGIWKLFIHIASALRPPSTSSGKRIKRHFKFQKLGKRWLVNHCVVLVNPCVVLVNPCVVLVDPCVVRQKVDLRRTFYFNSRITRKYVNTSPNCAYSPVRLRYGQSDNGCYIGKGARKKSRLIKVEQACFILH